MGYKLLYIPSNQKLANASSIKSQLLRSKRYPDTNQFISYCTTIDERVVSHASEYNSDKTRVEASIVMAPVLTILRLLLKYLREM